MQQSNDTESDDMQENIFHDAESPEKSNLDTPKTDIQDAWQSTLMQLKEKNNTLYSIAKTGSVDSYENGKISIAVTFPFHAKRLNESKNKIYITECLSSSIKDITDLVFIARPKPKSSEHIRSISNIFGAVEVLE